MTPVQIFEECAIRPAFLVLRSALLHRCIRLDELSCTTYHLTLPSSPKLPYLFLLGTTRVASAFQEPFEHTPVNAPRVEEGNPQLFFRILIICRFLHYICARRPFAKR
jgi:hypothetical protein